MVSAEQITVVINDVDAIIQFPEFQFFFAIIRGSVAKQSFLHLPSRARRDWYFVLASAESQDAKAKRNAQAS
jgi:hypothetical protein